MAVQSTVGKLCTIWNGCKGFLNNRNNFINFLPQTAFISGVRIKELKNKITELNTPEKPKRPLTPYFKYMVSVRSDIAAKNPGKKLKDIVKQIASQWDTVDENTKKRLQQEFKVEQEDYTKRMLAYEAKLTDEQRAVLSELRKASRQRAEKLVARKEVRELGKPKRPATGFMMFMIDKLKDRGSQKFSDYQHIVAQEWKDLPDAQKQPYHDRFKANQERYHKEVGEWEFQMVKEGNDHVVRKSRSLTINSIAQTKRKTNRKGDGEQ